VGLSDFQVADQIRTDRIDILVDLALHTAGNRLLVFARKPAPIQVSMLGMPATTGLTTMDYRLTDPYFDPPGPGDDNYAERSIRLSHSIWCYEPPDESPAVNELPALKNGYITFGCLNQFAKASRPALQVWLRTLQTLPGSRLILQAPRGGHRQEVLRRFEEGGVAGDRLEFADKVARPEYLCRFHGLDLSLDPFPYNGHTSSLDSLWMGVPVITLAGRTGVGRAGVSVLSNLGLPELIAETPEQYADIAAQWGRHPARLAELRSSLRVSMLESRLMDSKRYAAEVEDAFRRVWRTWCQA
jgi:predicted O-linked N-acetylglucosamine transferase (SPINDLY family)